MGLELVHKNEFGQVIHLHKAERKAQACILSKETTRRFYVRRKLRESAIVTPLTQKS